MPPAKRKRVITDRRREQNRGAQKIYRAKIRAKLQHLEGLQQTSSASNDTHDESEDMPAEQGSDHPSTEATDNPIPERDRRALAGSLSSNTSFQPFHVMNTTQLQSFVIQPYTSDPRLNHLNSPHISLISAGIENSLILNITQADALTPGFPSPFTDVGLTANSNTLRPGWWSTIPRDLYPTCLQISIPHQAWLDSIPIPSLRDGALTYLAAGRIQDHNFDLVELANDIDNGGLLCWGGIGTETHGTGTPWDARSWEARPWFLNKWECVTGGFEGELGRMSMWWWRLKGEQF